MRKMYAIGLSFVVAGLLTGCIDDLFGEDEDADPKAVLIYQHVSEQQCKELENEYDTYDYEEKEQVDVDIEYYTSFKQCSDYDMTGHNAETYDYNNYKLGDDLCVVYDAGGGYNGSCVVEVEVEDYLYGSYGAPERLEAAINN